MHSLPAGQQGQHGLCACAESRSMMERVVYFGWGYIWRRRDVFVSSNW